MFYRIIVNNTDKVYTNYSEFNIDLENNLFFNNEFGGYAFIYAYEDSNGKMHEVYTDEIIDNYKIIEKFNSKSFIENNFYLNNMKLDQCLTQLNGFNKKDNTIIIRTKNDQPIDLSFELYNELCNLLNIKNEFISYKHYYEKMLLKYEYIKLIISFRNKMSNINAINIDETNKFINEYINLIEIIKNKDLELDNKYKKSKHLIK